METTHTATLYRKTEGGAQDDRGRPKTSWDPIAEDLPGNLQEKSGKVVQQPEGREVQVVGKFFVHPDGWPDGVTPRQDDALVITAGRSSRTTFVVTHAALIDDGTGPFDDELELAATAESVP